MTFYVQVAFCHVLINEYYDDDDDEIAYFTVCWKTSASFVYRTKNIRWHQQRQ